MSKITLFYNNIETAKAVKRYLKFVTGFEDIVITPLNDPYGRKKIYETGMKSDLLLVEIFAGEKPVGFRFAREMEKKVLLIFYPDEIEIEENCWFCLLLPDELQTLSSKIKKVLSLPPPAKQEFEELERRFPILKGGNDHHGHHC